MDIRIGFIGLGEAGYCMAKGLRDEGISGIKAFDVALTLEGAYRRTVEDRAKDAGVVLEPSLEDLVRSSSVVFCAVQAQYARDVAQRALPVIAPGSIYVDVTTARPSQKKEIAQQFAERNLAYVDGAMMGALPVDRHKVPTLCSGQGAAEPCALMNPHGMRMECAEGPAGLASTLKLIRSSFTKGVEALAVETLLLAHKMGVSDTVLQSLAANYSKTTFDATLVRYIRSDMIHAGRRAHEVDDSASLMEECGIVPVMAKATAERMRRTEKLGLKEELGGVVPATAEEVYALWDAKNYS